MKIILCGTPNFTVRVFEEIRQHFDVIALISQPDQKAKRGNKLESPAPVIWAKENNIKVFQPNKIIDIYEDLNNLDFDVMLTYAFGQYIPVKILELPKIAALNIHGSLLPKYRGAGPIQHALLNDDKQTGINLIYMTQKMDAGDILFEAKLDILPNDTTTTLFEKISILSAKNIQKWLKCVENNNLKPIKQDESKVTLASKLNKEDGQLSELKSMQENLNIIRAYADNPAAFCFLEGKRVKVFMASKNIIKNAPQFKCSDGILYFSDYQFDSKKRIKLLG